MQGTSCWICVSPFKLCQSFIDLVTVGHAEYVHMIIEPGLDFFLTSNVQDKFNRFLWFFNTGILNKTEREQLI